MTFGSRLRTARKAKQLTQKELAAKIKAAHNSISNWENDQNMPDPDTIQNLCWALDVEPNYFFSVDSSPLNIVPMPKMRKIPLLGSIACGAPILAEEHIDGEVDTPKSIHADFALTCKGDSMINARIFDGDIVYIRQQETVENGEIAAVLIDNEATLKRVCLFGDHISLEPENPQYRPIVLWGDEMNTVRILGKAVAFTSLVR
jgi:repressor LexA